MVKISVACGRVESPCSSSSVAVHFNSQHSKTVLNPRQLLHAGISDYGSRRFLRTVFLKASCQCACPTLMCLWGGWVWLCADPVCHQERRLIWVSYGEVKTAHILWILKNAALTSGCPTVVLVLRFRRELSLHSSGCLSIWLLVYFWLFTNKWILLKCFKESFFL